MREYSLRLYLVIKINLLVYKTNVTRTPESKIVECRSSWLGSLGNFQFEIWLPPTPSSLTQKEKVSMCQYMRANFCHGGYTGCSKGPSLTPLEKTVLILVTILGCFFRKNQKFWCSYMKGSILPALKSYEKVYLSCESLYIVQAHKLQPSIGLKY